MPIEELSSSARRVKSALEKLGYQASVRELPTSTRTAREAAQAVGCNVGQIAKSLVFRGRQSNRALLVIASGANRVDEARLAEIVGEPIEKADAEFVRARTGFTIGGVPPLGHAEHLPTFIDRDLLAFDEIWAAAGTPNAIFRVKPTDLTALTEGTVIAVC